jgi:hypothetical protein
LTDIRVIIRVMRPTVAPSPASGWLIGLASLFVAVFLYNSISATVSIAPPPRPVGVNSVGIAPELYDTGPDAMPPLPSSSSDTPSDEESLPSADHPAATPSAPPPLLLRSPFPSASALPAELAAAFASYAQSSEEGSPASPQLHELSLPPQEGLEVEFEPLSPSPLAAAALTAVAQPQRPPPNTKPAGSPPAPSPFVAGTAPLVPAGAPRPLCVPPPDAAAGTGATGVTPAPSVLPCGPVCSGPALGSKQGQGGANSKPRSAPLVVRATGGIARRLRVLLSYLAVARLESRRLTVVWLSEPDCPATFAELFEPLPTNVAADVNILADAAHAPANAPLVHGVAHPAFNGAALLGPMLLRLIKPRPELAAAISGLLQRLGPSFSAAHLRRTDLPAAAGAAGDAMDVAVAAWACNDTQPLFVATDHPRSLNAIRRLLPPGQVVSRGVFPHMGSALRKTSIADAVVDMWVASHASRFVGTPTSSFSEAVEAMRLARGLKPGG